MRVYPVKCFRSDGSEKEVSIKAISDAQAVDEAKIVRASEQAVDYEVYSYVKNGRKTVRKLIFDTRKADHA